MSMQAKTRAVIDAAYEILAELHPMTLRQLYYQLVSKQVLKNELSRYAALSRALVQARELGMISWTWMEDRTREPHRVSMWSDLVAYAPDVISSYRRDVWAEQKNYFEVWCEKDALSGIFLEVLRPYGVTLRVGRGYDSATSAHGAAEDYAGEGRHVDVVYFGDFDPSGEDMVDSLRDRFARYGAHDLDIIKVALTPDDIERYKLPPSFAKKSDTRYAKHFAKYGDIAVELDALPIEVLRDRIKTEVEKRMDLDALESVREQEADELRGLSKSLGIGNPEDAP